MMTQIWRIDEELDAYELFGGPTGDESRYGFLMKFKDYSFAKNLTEVIEKEKSKLEHLNAFFYCDENKESHFYLTVVYNETLEVQDFIKQREETLNILPKGELVNNHEYFNLIRRIYGNTAPQHKIDTYEMIRDSLWGFLGESNHHVYSTGITTGYEFMTDLSSMEKFDASESLYGIPGLFVSSVIDSNFRGLSTIIFSTNQKNNIFTDINRLCNYLESNHIEFREISGEPMPGVNNINAIIILKQTHLPFFSGSGYLKLL